VIALILGAGLKALKLSKDVFQTKKANQSFPILKTIAEEDETTDNILEVIEVSNQESEIDPDDAACAEGERDSEINSSDSNDASNENNTGIGFTLRKVFIFIALPLFIVCF
jgi:hypothetical protein